jgi:hypothetical protein
MRGNADVESRARTLHAAVSRAMRNADAADVCGV